VRCDGIAASYEKRTKFPGDHDGADPVIARQLKEFRDGEKIQTDNQSKELWDQVVAAGARQ
jgi:hypothetical protein